jgi:hypothetical protein
MNTKLILGAILSLLLASALAWGQNVSPADVAQAQPEPGVSIESKGPIHEAYAQPGDVKPEPSPLVSKKPPDPIPEQPPELKPQGENVQWIPGYWAWDVDRNDFLWVSGFWRVPPAGRHWVAGYWGQVQGGWQWVPGYWASDNQEQVPYVADVPESLDTGPSVPAPSDDSFYVPGIWVPSDGRFLWRPGYWANAEADMVWNNACYSWTPNGYLFNDGYWDYPLADRGLLFAPVYFTQPLWTTPGWCYRPSYCLNWDGLLASLFLRPGWCHYYFGDYYGANYWGRGFRPWYAYGGRFHDCLFQYYNWLHRGNPHWYAGLHNAYFGGHGLSPVSPLNQWHQHGLRTTATDLVRQRPLAQHSQIFAHEYRPGRPQTVEPKHLPIYKGRPAEKRPGLANSNRRGGAAGHGSAYSGNRPPANVHNRPNLRSEQLVRPANHRPQIAARGVPAKTYREGSVSRNSHSSAPAMRSYASAPKVNRPQHPTYRSSSPPAAHNSRPAAHASGHATSHASSAHHR